MSDNKALFRYIMQFGDQAYLFFLRKKVFKTIGKLNVTYSYSDEPIPFAERTFSTPLQVGERWSKKQNGCGWFRFTGKVPRRYQGKENTVVLLIDIGGEGCFYAEDGTPIAGITDVSPVGRNFHILRGKQLLELPENAYDIDICMEAGDNAEGGKRGKLIRADIALYDKERAKLFYDVETLSLVKPYVPYISKARRVYSSSITKAEYFTLQNKIGKARKCLAQGMTFGKENTNEIFAVGHGHLDLAFMWPIRETKRKMVRTFINQLNLMERYPDYVYGASQPQQFCWLENVSPSLFSRLVEAEKRGQLEIQGGMWVESDTNLPSGESLIRQCVYGQQYFLEKFGHRVKVCWLPDCFGFSGNLPQIIKKCGMDYFLTTKMSWADTNVFPKHTFLWQGIDGTAVLAHFPPEEAYSGEALPVNILPAEKNYAEKNTVPIWGSLFGMGDGGAGPSIGHIETYKRIQQINYLPKVTFSPLVKMFEKMSEYEDRLSVYKGELYLERHRGTYTSQSKTKYLNYTAEKQLHNTEFLCSYAEKYGYRYPKEEIDEIWREVLLYQFHDVLPGSSVERVYAESRERYALLLQKLSDFEKEARKKLQGKTAVFWNSTGFSGEYTEISNGQKLISTLVPYGASRVTFLRCKNDLCGDETFLENTKLRLSFGEDGEISSIFDKVRGEEKVGGYANRFILYTDIPKKFDAWDIDYDYLTSPSTVLKCTGVSFGRDEGKIWHEATYNFSSSQMTRKVILEEDSDVVYVECTVDWHETHKMLRVESVPRLFDKEVVCDIQCGVIRRPTTVRDRIEKAQFEICAHKFIDIGSMAFFAEAKYGWRVKEGVVSLNLLRSPVYPDKNCDRGEHFIRYAFYPHNGDYVDGKVYRRAYLYHNPPKLILNGVELPSYVCSDNENVIIETIKKSQNGAGKIVRLYNGTDRRQMARLAFADPMESIKETDMLEEDIGLVNNESLCFEPFEIKTIRWK